MKKRVISLITLFMAALHTPTYAQVAPPQTGTSSEYGTAEATFTSPDNDVIPPPKQRFAKTPMKNQLKLNYDFLKKRSKS